ncbi:MAG: AMP-binding protein [Pseudoflavonifractor sp.]|nr:AMP-binding protein [Pseudoflavonifractor sp.]
MKNYPWYPTVYYNTFRDFIAGLATFGEKPAICQYDENGVEHVRTYRELCDDVARIRRSLAARGLAESRIAIAGENSYEWIVLFLATVSGGGVAICVDIDQADGTVCQLIRQADANVIFASESMLPICARLLQDGGSRVQHIFGLRADQASSAPDGGYYELSAEGAVLGEPPLPELSPDRPAAIVFTSGTTATAKAVKLTHRNMLQNAGAAVATVDLGQTIFTGLPFYHAYGLNCGVFCSLLKCARLTINGNLRTMMRDMALSQSRTIITVPLMLEAIYNATWSRIRRDGREASVNSLLKRYFALKKVGIQYAQAERMKLRDAYFGSMRVIVCGGAHMNTELSKRFEALGILVLQGYGITECSPLIAVNRNDFWCFDSVGTPLPGFEVKLEQGEILVRGPSVMAGYYNDPEATALNVVDGWFKTGDLGEIGSEGQLYIIGRSKNLIVLKNGKKISPEKIEQLVQEIPIVKETMVYGAISGTAADDVKPAVSIYPDPELTAGMEPYEILAALQREVDRINENLPSYQQLQMINIREKEFAKTSSQKPKRFEAENRTASAVK